MLCLRADDRDERRTGEGADDQSLVEADVVVARTEVDEVTRTNGDDTSDSHCPEQALRDVEDHREAHGRYGGRDGEGDVVVVRRHAQVGHEVVDTTEIDGRRLSERHGQDHQQDVRGPGDADIDISVDHVVHEVDQRHTGHDEERAGHEGMPGCGADEKGRQRGGYRRIDRQEGREPCQQRGHEGGDGDAHQPVHALASEPSLEIHAHRSGDGGIEERCPVATELNAEAAAGEARSDGHLQGSVVAGHRLDLVELLFEALQRIVLLDGRPEHLAHSGDGGHVDAVLLDALELRERVLLITQVHHQHVVTDVNVDVALGQSEVGFRTPHVAEDSGRVSQTLHQNASYAKEQIQLAAKKNLGC